jgi:H+/Cl- antiporter ClcA
MEKTWRSLDYWVELVIGIACGLLVYGLLHTLEHLINATRKPDFHISLLTHVLIELAVVTIVTLFLKLRQSSLQSIRSLNQSTKDLQASIDLKTDAAMLSQGITRNY